MIYNIALYVEISLTNYLLGTSYYLNVDNVGMHCKSQKTHLR
jgi:hypothetical protein